jgi:hypothetical protein
MKAWIRAVAPCVAACVVLGAGAEARAGTRWHGFSGITCVAQDPSQASCIVRTPRWGVHNTCSQAVTVLCPIPTFAQEGEDPSLATSQQLTANVYDRSATDDIRCQFYRIWATGEVDEPPAAASTAWRWPPMTIDFGRNAWNNGNIGAVGNVVSCSIPGVDQGFSHIVGFTVTTPFRTLP